MGGPRASTMRRIYAGIICCHCDAILPERIDGRSGERSCQRCMESRLVRVVMTFGHYKGKHHAAFLESDAKTPLPWKGSFSSEKPLFDMVRQTYQSASAERELETKLHFHGQGSVTLLLTPSQYDRIKNPTRRRRNA